MRAYIIDTGIRFSHIDFGGRAKSGYDAVDGGTADDCNGHGTHVAGTVGGAAYGVAKGATLVAVRVLDCSGSGTVAGVVAGVNWVTAHAVKPAVANLSLGGGASMALDDAVRNSISSGVTYAVAAGNGGTDACTTSPARLAEAVTVGATTSTDARASYSNYGKCLDLFAPGSNIRSDWYSGTTATATLSGTSMATPHVTGAAALWLARDPGWSPTQVRSQLVASATAAVVGGRLRFPQPAAADALTGRSGSSRGCADRPVRRSRTGGAGPPPGSVTGGISLPWFAGWGAFDPMPRQQVSLPAGVRRVGRTRPVRRRPRGSVDRRATQTDEKTR